MFHVKLFAEAEPAEQRVENIFNSRASRQTIECCPSQPEILGNQHGVLRIGRSRQRIRCLFKVRRLPPVERDCILRSEHHASPRLNLCQQRSHALARHRRDRQRTFWRLTPTGKIGLGVNRHQPRVCGRVGP